ncbi:MAG: hypothetical protein LBQ22_05505 [Bacteroidales bacterium]|jgi:hypothetical protein|nr:hypothetical protein [Bacteroidales bacterium]
MNKEVIITDRVKTFEDACNILGLDPKQHPVADLLPEKDRRAIIAFYKLTVIVRALNEGWEPNWLDWNEWKYYNWFYLDSAGFGFAATNIAATCASTSIGSQLCFKTSALARYARETFRDLYFEFLFIDLPKNYGK